MTISEWEQEKALFLAALDEPAEDRLVFIARAAGEDVSLRDRVASLLASHDTAGEFMETPAAALSVDSIPPSFPHNGRIGPYRLLTEIGRGGMGAVYRAAREDGEFQHEVALKLVKRGMDTDAILARFRYERQILAGLDHPNIARLLDGGTTGDGLPYFVLELVEGTSLREYCAGRGASIDERLVLFRSVCDAVEYAHRNLVVHRDIKSSNIVVSASGVPKLLDFGIAKLLDPSRAVGAPGEHTLTETLRAMTPDYASPEQIRGEPVTTSTDVYSLGVLLYELLAGQRPFSLRDAGPEEIARAVCDTEPSLPSAAVSGPDAATTRERLRGDLDTIVMMAMHKDPARRYPSVAQLADDIERYRTGQPVRAQRDTLVYRTTKFVRRNRVGLAAVTLIALSLVGGLVATSWQARVARTERLRAERRFAEVRALATSFLFEVHDAIVELPGATPARALLVKRGLASLDGLAREANGDPVLQRELAVAYQRVGLVQGNSYNSNLGDTQGALASYRKSVKLLEAVVEAGVAEPDVQYELSGAYKGFADMLGITGDLTSAVANFERGRAALQRAVSARPKDVEYRRALANLYFEMGDAQGGASLANVGDTESALRSYRAAIAIREAMRAEHPNDVEVRAGLANTLVNLGSLQLMLGDVTGIARVREGIALLEDIVAARPDDTARRNSLLAGYMRLRQPLADRGAYDEAITIDRKTLVSLQRMVTDDPLNTFFRRNLGVTFNTLGRDLRASGEAVRAAESHRRALEIATQLASADPTSSEHRQDVATTRGMLAEALLDARDYPAALSQYRQAIALRQLLRDSEPATERHGDDLAGLYAGIGTLHLALRDYDAADAVLRQAIPLADAATTRASSSISAKSTGATVYAALGRLYAMQSERATSDVQRTALCRRATTWYTKSMTIWTAMRTSGTLSADDVVKEADAMQASKSCATLG